jgi:four helix bundle protein
MGPKSNVYVRALDIVNELGPLVDAVQRRDRKLADQLRRAAQSVVLNIAEARGNRDGNARLRFSTACGSAKETRAALTIASAWGYIDSRRVAPLDRELDEVCAITWVLGRKG